MIDEPRSPQAHESPTLAYLQMLGDTDLTPAPMSHRTPGYAYALIAELHDLGMLTDDEHQALKERCLWL
ncbi:hypothetical protein [Pseudonocardia acaciae]|uniref:hypothetical protein n=1 Tax=Pseudonocardia acaciae TaxID=551276 RepID=UPI000491598E|nr:hypothetical protein [Pseudonocardia acaciae]